VATPVVFLNGYTARDIHRIGDDVYFGISNSLRKKPHSGGDVVTLSTAFNDIYGIDSDSLDNLWIADSYNTTGSSNNGLKRMTPAGVITNVAPGYRARSVFVENDNNILFCTNTHLYRYTVSTGVISTLLENVFNFGTSIDKDKDGNIYVADYNNMSVKKWDGTTLTTIYTHPTSKLPSAKIYLNRIYCTLENANIIISMALDGTDVQTYISGLTFPKALYIYSPDSLVYWSDILDNKIYYADLPPPPYEYAAAGFDYEQQSSITQKSGVSFGYTQLTSILEHGTAGFEYTQKNSLLEHSAIGFEYAQVARWQEYGGVGFEYAQVARLHEYGAAGFDYEQQTSILEHSAIAFEYTQVARLQEYGSAGFDYEQQTSISQKSSAGFSYTQLTSILEHAAAGFEYTQLARLHEYGGVGFEYAQSARLQEYGGVSFSYTQQNSTSKKSSAGFEYTQITSFNITPQRAELAQVWSVQAYSEYISQALAQNRDLPDPPVAPIILLVFKTDGIADLSLPLESIFIDRKFNRDQTRYAPNGVALQRGRITSHLKARCVIIDASKLSAVSTHANAEPDTLIELFSGYQLASGVQIADTVQQMPLTRWLYSSVALRGGYVDVYASELAPVTDRCWLAPSWYELNWMAHLWGLDATAGGSLYHLYKDMLPAEVQAEFESTFNDGPASLTYVPTNEYFTNDDLTGAEVAPGVTVTSVSGQIDRPCYLAVRINRHISAPLGIYEESVIFRLETDLGDSPEINIYTNTTTVTLTVATGSVIFSLDTGTYEYFLSLAVRTTDPLHWYFDMRSTLADAVAGKNTFPFILPVCPRRSAALNGERRDFSALGLYDIIDDDFVFHGLDLGAYPGDILISSAGEIPIGRVQITVTHSNAHTRITPA
jgi:hypothetical protein